MVSTITGTLLDSVISLAASLITEEEAFYFEITGEEVPADGARESLEATWDLAKSFVSFLISAH